VAPTAWPASHSPTSGCDIACRRNPEHRSSWSGACTRMDPVPHSQPASSSATAAKRPTSPRVRTPRRLPPGDAPSAARPSDDPPADRCTIDATRAPLSFGINNRDPERVNPCTPGHEAADPNGTRPHIAAGRRHQLTKLALAPLAHRFAQPIVRNRRHQVARKIAMLSADAGVGLAEHSRCFNARSNRSAVGLLTRVASSTSRVVTSGFSQIRSTNAKPFAVPIPAAACR